VRRVRLRWGAGGALLPASAFAAEAVIFADECVQVPPAGRPAFNRRVPAESTLFGQSCG